jgi:hypothetical protein
MKEPTALALLLTDSSALFRDSLEINRLRLGCHLANFCGIRLYMTDRPIPRLALLLLTLSNVGCWIWPQNGEDFGKFVGRVVAQWDDSGREMVLTEPFGYLDPEGNKWDAPAGSKIDGASIPKFAWSFIGGPFEGKYRNASVIHDVACDQKQRPWDKVHETFYYAMRASGVDDNVASTMYGAVYFFGPRWEETITRQVRDEDVEKTVKEIKARRDPKNRFDVMVDRPTKIPDKRPGVEPRSATIRVKVTPPAKELSERDFEELRSLINKRAASGKVSLEEIRTFRPPQR